MSEPTKGPDGGEEPTVLGAAPTLPFRRETRAERAERRRAARQARAERAAATTPSGHGGLPDAPPAGHGDDTMSTAPPLREYSDIEYVFEPHSTMLPNLREYVRSIWARRRLIREMARAQIQRTRANTVLGELWGILDPLLLSAIYVLVFTIIREGQRPQEFIPLLIANVILFQLASAGMNEGASSISGGKGLILNSTFPRAVLPVTAIYKGVVKFIPVLLVYPFFFFALGAEGGRYLVVLPLLFALQVLLMLGLALLFATLVVYFRDFKNMLTYIVRLMFFTSPIIYPVAFVPDEIRQFLVWQPFFALFANYQMTLGGETPSLGYAGLTATWAAVVFVIGGWVFLRRERDFANHL